MKKIGITGGIGSGKSVVCNIFKLLGVPVFDADYEAKKMYKNQLVQAEMLAAFGTDIFTENELDLKKIAAQVFENNEKLAQLNSIIHPKLAVIFDDWCTKNAEQKYVLKEAAVMIESGAYKQCDELILVTAPLELRIERVMQRNGITREEVLNRVTKQLTDEEKMPFVKHLIVNDEKSFLINQVIQLHNKILEE